MNIIKAFPSLFRPNNDEEGELEFRWLDTEEPEIIRVTLPTRFEGLEKLVGKRCFVVGVMLHESNWPTGGRQPLPGEVWRLRGVGPYIDGNFQFGFTLMFASNWRMSQVL